MHQKQIISGFVRSAALSSLSEWRWRATSSASRHEDRLLQRLAPRVWRRQRIFGNQGETAVERWVIVPAPSA